MSPSSRGIGLQLARHLLRTTDLPIVATAKRDLDKTRDDILTEGNGPEAQDAVDTSREGSGEEEARLRVLRIDVEGMTLLGWMEEV